MKPFELFMQLVFMGAGVSVMLLFIGVTFLLLSKIKGKLSK